MTLLIPLVLVLCVTWLCGALARRLGQAAVIGEMLGGILLGPTLLERAVPKVWHALFTPATLSALEALSTVGLVLYLFLIGLDLDATHLRRQGKAAAVATLASLLLPIAFACAIARPVERVFGVSGNPVAFVLFFSISFSITAFPVLARILDERGLSGAPLGVTALLCAAADDVCAWMLLALAMSFVPRGADAWSLPVRLLLLVVYLGMMALLAAVARQLAPRFRANPLSTRAMIAVLLVVLASAAVTDMLGLHPLFGAFVAGLCFPRMPHWTAALRERVELPVTGLLLPVFFALTGLSTRMDLLQGSGVFRWLLLILLLAVAGKVGGGIIAARVAGDTWRNGVALGAMLNTRGLVELIVLNIALTQGVFTPSLFAALVVMALATTMITSPVLNGLRIGTPPSVR